jgi:hypothetical protein
MPEPFTCYVIGENTLLIKCAKILLDKGHKISGVITPSHKISKWAKEINLPTYELNTNLPGILTSESFDYLFSITNLSIVGLQKLSGNFLKKLRDTFSNYKHFSSFHSLGFEDLQDISPHTQP